MQRAKWPIAVVLAWTAQAAWAATPFSLAPCRIGEQALDANTPLSRVRTALSRAFPRAQLVEAAASDPAQRRLRLVEGGETVLMLDYYPRAAGQPLADMLFVSRRFLLAPGVSPGTSLASLSRSAGPVTISYNPEIGVEDLDAPGLQATFAGWEGKGCTVNLRLGPDARVGRYRQGATDTRQYKAGARITGIEVAF